MLSARNAQAEQQIILFGLAPRELIALSSVFFGVIMILLPARLYVRAGMLHSFGLDDWLLVVATVCRTLTPTT